MNRILRLTSALMLAATVAHAQAGGQRIGVATRLQQGYNQLKTNLTQAAEKMTDETAGYKPAPEIRTLAGQFAHVAQFHYIFCSQVKGGTNPNTANLEETATTKAAAIKALADSFVYCDDAFATLTDDTASQYVAGGRGGEQARAVPLMNLIAHDNEEYGIITVYLRLKGMVPPSTENQGRGRGAAGGGRGRGRE